MVNKAELRQFITQYFNNIELDELCFDYYPDLLDQFSTEMTESQKVIALIGYCERRGMFDHLLTTLAKLRPDAYQKRFGQLTETQASSYVAGRNPEQDTTPAPELPTAKVPEPAVPASAVELPPANPAPEPAATLGGEAATSVPGKPLYWALGLVAVVAVAFLGWRLMAAGAGGGSGSEVSDITPVTRLVEESGAGTGPTRTPPRRPTEAPTTTLARQPSETPAPTQTQAPDSQTHSAWDIRTVSRGGVDVEQVFVPAGSFMMGSEDGQDDVRPVHEVTLDAFWIDRTEVTNAQYSGCVADGACRPPADISSYTHDDYYGNDEFADYPVIWVSWNDASDFCEWAGGRLPTEALWEYAARGPESFTYPWGNPAPSCGLLNFNGDCVGDTSRVGSYPDGESWVGALDMAGNVWEWVNDWYDSGYYGISSGENPPGPASGEYRVLRGGAWVDGGPVDDGARSSYRGSLQPDDRYDAIGFRCAHE